MNQLRVLSMTLSLPATLPATLLVTLLATSLPNKPNESAGSDIEDEDPYELPTPVCINLAYKAWIENKGVTSIRNIACSYGVVYSTLQRRINGCISQLEANQAMQRLTPSEEDAIE